MAAMAPPEEGKMLAEALSTVKIQVQQMKRYLVRSGGPVRPGAVADGPARRSSTSSWTA
jgi:hypothetical protein